VRRGFKKATRAKIHQRNYGLLPHHHRRRAHGDSGFGTTGGDEAALTQTLPGPASSRSRKTAREEIRRVRVVGIVDDESHLQKLAVGDGFALEIRSSEP
jgi:hypothetical protein